MMFDTLNDPTNMYEAETHFQRNRMNFTPISVELSEAIETAVDPCADPYEGVAPNFDIDPQTGDFLGDEVIG